MRVARVTMSDRASAGVYQDLSGPAIERVFAEHCREAVEWVRVLIADERDQIERTLKNLCDDERCELVFTTGGTGPAPRDVTPEATRAVLDRELPGFGEIMRVQSFSIVPTAILSRAVAGTRGSCLILNLPGNPRAIDECLPMLMPAIMEARRHLAE